MDQRTIPILFTLVRSAICGTRLTDEERNAYSPQCLPELLRISSKHDIAHLLALGLKQNGLITKEDVSIGKSIFEAVYRYEQRAFAYEKLCDALEKAQIPFLPLKGSVIRKHYPEEWMRTSCDIDVLVHEKDLERAKNILVREHGYTDHEKGSHDISLFAPNKVHLELHYDLVEEGLANASSEVLKNVWDTAVIRSGFGYWYEMPDEMFYFYHIAHMAKHFESGGCGIRSLIDLWILDGIADADTEKRKAILAQGKLLKFAETAQKLAKVWFEDGEYEPVVQQMEQYIVSGGVYGNSENRIALQQQKKGGRFRYVLSKLFIPYDVIKFHYPVLQKLPWLTPVMEVRRWGKLIFCGHLRRTTKELRFSNRITGEQARSMQQFLDDIGLS